MSIDRGDSTIAKNLKGKVEAVTYASKPGDYEWLTIDGTKYAAKVDFDKFDIYPGVKVEHAPYVDSNVQIGKLPLMATKLVKIIK